MHQRVTSYEEGVETILTMETDLTGFKVSDARCNAIEEFMSTDYAKSSMAGAVDGEVFYEDFCAWASLHYGLCGH